MCPHQCGIDRSLHLGFCGQTATVQISSICAHHGEEPALSGAYGAGTIFVAGCNMRCAFCQNYQISQKPPYRAEWEYSTQTLAQAYLDLQEQGCHNIEWVSPTTHLPALVEALAIAREHGLTLPVVYNTNGYDSLKVLRLLDGIVDIYLPDAKYADDDLAARYSHTPGYVEVNRQALLEMWRQVGLAQFDEQGIAKRGVIIRHLVLPGQIGNTEETLRWIAQNLGRQVHVSLMSQYHPMYLARAAESTAQIEAELRRQISPYEYKAAVEALEECGLENGWVQDLSSHDYYLPDFDEKHQPFKK